MTKQQAKKPLRTAYLVVFLDTGQYPPCVSDAGIFSEQGHKLTHALTESRTAVTAAEAQAQSYEAAQRELLDMVRSTDLPINPYSWLRPWLKDYA